MFTLTDELLQQMACNVTDKLYTKPLHDYSVTGKNLKADATATIKKMLLIGFQTHLVEVGQEVSDIRIISVINNVAKGILEVQHISDLKLIQ